MVDLRGVATPEELRPGTVVATSSGMRSCDPSDLRGSLAHLLAYFGITRVAHLTGFDRLGVPVCMAIRPQGRTLSSGSGKGTTRDGSWVSAVMEAAEQSVWESVTPSALECSERELDRRGEAYVPGARFPIRRGAIWNDHIPIRWRSGWDLVAGEAVLVPDSLVEFGSAGLSPFLAGSNGLASGTRVAEAILSGLLEVVERDGLMLHVVHRFAPLVDLEAGLAEAAPDLGQVLADSRVRLQLFDATTEIGVPTFLCLLGDAPGERVGSFMGSGAGTANATAIVRAVTEAVQSRSLIVAGARDDIYSSQRRSSFRQTPRPTEVEPVSPPPRSWSTGSLLGDIDEIVARLVRAGFDRVVVVRHSDPGDPIQVVRVLVPGLEGYPFAKAAPGPRAATWTGAPAKSGLRP